MMSKPPKVCEFIEFDIRFFNKAHIIMEHFPRILERTGRGLYSSLERNGRDSPKVFNLLQTGILVLILKAKVMERIF